MKYHLEVWFSQPPVYFEQAIERKIIPYLDQDWLRGWGIKLIDRKLKKVSETPDNFRAHALFARDELFRLGINGLVSDKLCDLDIDFGYLVTVELDFL